MDKALPGQIYDADVTDSLIDLLEERVVAIEAVVAARGWRRLAAAWRLGRSLRASVLPFEGGSFAERRYEAVSIEWGSTQNAGLQAAELEEGRNQPSSRRVSNGRPGSAPALSAGKSGLWPGGAFRG
jgi:hypothetical protein